MCSNCEDHGCNCTGGSVSASCRCEEGAHCPACGHNPVSQTDLLVISDPDVGVEIIELA